MDYSADHLERSQSVGECKLRSPKSDLGWRVGDLNKFSKSGKPTKASV